MPGFVYADDYFKILAMGAGAALLLVGAAAGSSELAKPTTVSGIRQAVNGALTQAGLPPLP